MPAEDPGDELELGEDEDEAEKEEYIRGGDVLQYEATEGRQIWGNAEVKGEVGVEEGQEVEDAIVIAPK